MQKLRGGNLRRRATTALCVSEPSSAKRRARSSAIYMQVPKLPIIASDEEFTDWAETKNDVFAQMPPTACRNLRPVKTPAPYDWQRGLGLQSTIRITTAWKEFDRRGDATMVGVWLTLSIDRPSHLCVANTVHSAQSPTQITIPANSASDTESVVHSRFGESANEIRKGTSVALSSSSILKSTSSPLVRLTDSR